MTSPFITGKKIYFRGILPEDLPQISRWMSDPEVTHFLFMGDRPANLKLIQEQYDRDQRAADEVSIAVVDKKSDRIIGWGGLYRINWISRTAEYRVFIGDKKYWNKGFGTEIARLLVGYGFDKLNLNKVWLGVNADHLGAFHSYKKAGFVQEGVLRQEIYRNGKYYDAVRMSILKKEYEKTQ